MVGTARRGGNEGYPTAVVLESRITEIAGGRGGGAHLFDPK
jgi:hypothetical protein